MIARIHRSLMVNVHPIAAIDTGPAGFVVRARRRHTATSRQHAANVLAASLDPKAADLTTGDSLSRTSGNRGR